jgi:hypothetical protein
MMKYNKCPKAAPTAYLQGLVLISQARLKLSHIAKAHGKPVM